MLAIKILPSGYEVYPSFPIVCHFLHKTGFLQTVEKSPESDTWFNPWLTLASKEAQNTNQHKLNPATTTGLAGVRRFLYFNLGVQVELRGLHLGGGNENLELKPVS